MSLLYAVPLARLMKLDTLSPFFYYELLMTVILLTTHESDQSTILLLTLGMKVIKVQFYC